MKLSVKFKKILSRIQSYLKKNHKNPLHRIFQNFAESFIVPFWLLFRNKKMGVTEFVFEI